MRVCPSTIHTCDHCWTLVVIYIFITPTLQWYITCCWGVAMFRTCCIEVVYYLLYIWYWQSSVNMLWDKVKATLNSANWSTKSKEACLHAWLCSNRTPCLSLNPLDCQVTAQQCSSEELITKIMSEPSTWQMRLNPTSPSYFANKSKMTQPNKPIYTTKSTEQVQHTQPIDLKIVNLVLTICNCVFSWARHFNAVRFRDRQ